MQNATCPYTSDAALDELLIGGLSGEIRVEKSAVDGHAGTILRVYRERQMSVDSQFLQRLWPKVKQSILFLMAQDPDESGLLRGRQYNTLELQAGQRLTVHIG